MKVQAKLTAALLITSLVASIAVGGIAYWMVMRDFRAEIMDQAFRNFQVDVVAYLDRYGSLEKAFARESFHEFVSRRRHDPGETTGAQLAPIDRGDTPPFRFLLLDPRGKVLKGVDEFRYGDTAPDEVLRDARPIEYNGTVVALASPIGEPALTRRDRGYLGAMRKALVTGVMIAVALAVVLGVLLGRRMSAALRELTRAVHAMQANREAEVQVPVRSRDEIGGLTAAFNLMNRELAQAHRELRVSSEEVRSQVERQREENSRDPLTNLYNRRHLDEQAQTVYDYCTRNGHNMAVMMADLDHFKRINDHYSHAVGDKVLRTVAKLLTRGVRKSDLVARYGGEEFVILFPHTDIIPAARCCEALRRSVETYPWYQIHPNLRVTISIGLSDAISAGSVERMLADADDRLYQAKRGGRNRVVRRPEWRHKVQHA
jgi:diguanylate cyclase (GGDEF)-like protein